MEAFGKCLKGVKDKSENTILPLIFGLTADRTVLLISSLYTRNRINKIEKNKISKAARDRKAILIILNSDFCLFVL